MSISDEDFEKARASLLRIWNDPGSKLSYGLLQRLDDVLRFFDKQFPNSAERRDVWLNDLLTLTAERRMEDHQLDNLAGHILRDLAKASPEATGRRLAAHLIDPEWPPLYRRALLGGLLTAYRRTELPDLMWEPTLHAFFIELMKNGPPFAIRVAAGDLEYYAGLEASHEPGVRRRYSPDAKVKAALHDGVERLRRESVRPNADQEFGLAADEMARVVELLEKPSKP
jgi:hypothetical protein